MPNKELLDFIQKSRAFGQTDQQIREILKQNGWQDTILEEVFRSQVPQIQSPQTVGNYSSVSPITESVPAVIISKERILSSHKIMLLVGTLVILVGGALGGYFFVLNKDKPETLSAQIATSTSEQSLFVNEQVEQNQATSSPTEKLLLDKPTGSIKSIAGTSSPIMESSSTNSSQTASGMKSINVSTPTISGEIKTAVINGINSDREIFSSGNVVQIRQLSEILYKNNSTALAYISALSDSDLLQMSKGYTTDFPTNTQMNSSTAVWTQPSATTVRIIIESSSGTDSFNARNIDGKWHFDGYSKLT